MWRTAVVAIALVHAAVLVGCVAAFVVLPFTEPWYVALPLDAFIVHLFFDSVWVCPLTQAENAARRRAGMPTIHGWLKHYALSVRSVTVHAPDVG